MTALPIVETPPGADELMTRQAAERIGLSIAGVLDAIRRGRLPAVRRYLAGLPQGVIYVSVADVDAYAASVGPRRAKPGRPGPRDRRRYPTADRPVITPRRRADQVRQT